MNQILVTFYLTRIAYAFFEKIANDENFGLYIELFADAVFYGGYRDFSMEEKSLKDKKRCVLCQAKLNPRIHTILRRFERLGYSRSWIFEEALFYAKKRGFFEGI